MRGMKAGAARRERPSQKTKGHRVIAVPLCSTGLAPPAFTAPCRNQTGDSQSDNGKQCARRVIVKIRSFCG